MKFLKKIDQGVTKFITVITALLVLLMIAIVCAMVFSRFVLRVNLGGYEELPTYILCWCIWLGAIMIARNDEHMKVELLFMVVKNKKAQTIIKAFTSFLSTIALAYFITRAGHFVIDAYVHKDVTPALLWPAWIIYSVSLIGSIGLTIYTGINTIKHIRRLKEL